MILSLAKRITDKCIELHIISENEIVYQYGFAMLLSYSIGATFILMYGIFSSQLLESIIYLALFDKIRCHAGGYHANSYLKCNLSFISLFFVYITISKLTSFTFIFLLASLLFIAIYKFLPIEHPNKPLSAKQRIESKRIVIFRIIICLIVALLLCKSSQLGNYICTCIVIIILLCILQIIINRRRKSHE